MPAVKAGLVNGARDVARDASGETVGRVAGRMAGEKSETAGESGECDGECGRTAGNRLRMAGQTSWRRVFSQSFWWGADIVMVRVKRGVAWDN